LASRIGSEVVVFGRLKKKVEERHLEPLGLEVRYEARALPSGTTLAEVYRSFPPDARGLRLCQELDRQGALRVGFWAPAFKPSLSREFEYVIVNVVGQLLREAGAELRGHRLAVAPVRTATFENQEVFDFLRAFNEERRSFLAKVDPWQEGDPRQKVLDLGPVTIMGRSFKTLREARDYLRVLQRRSRIAFSGSLSEELTDLLYEEMRRQAEGVQIMLSLKERRAIEDYLAFERRIAEETESIDPKTISKLTTPGTEFLLLSRFRCVGQQFVLSAWIVDTKTGRRLTRKVLESLDPRLTADIQDKFKL